MNQRGTYQKVIVSNGTNGGPQQKSIKNSSHGPLEQRGNKTLQNFSMHKNPNPNKFISIDKKRVHISNPPTPIFSLESPIRTNPHYIAQIGPRKWFFSTVFHIHYCRQKKKKNLSHFFWHCF
ncbi:hypothetical protein V6N13_147946 [Hibiscus sabdariffa]